MNLRGAPTTIVLALAAASCSTGGKLDIRPVGQPTADARLQGSDRILMAQSHLALGNVALALEEFRRAEREQPGSAIALAGMANCYDRMGRGDLSRRYYEQALAAAPDQPALYQALATSLEGQGVTEEAHALRREAAALGSATVPKSASPVGSVIALPEVAAPSVPMPSAIAAMPSPTLAKSRVRLERMSSGEVALVSRGEHLWTAHTVAVSARSVTISFERRAAITVLNAARVARLAAQTRDYLAARGFAGARIGDAPATRRQTLILYPRTARSQAERIAAQLPFAPRLVQGEGPLTLMVGRDAATSRVNRGA